VKWHASPNPACRAGAGCLHFATTMKLLSRLAAGVAALCAAAALAAADLTDQLGLQTWTLRNLDFNQVVEFAQRHGIKNLQMIGKHLDPGEPAAEIERKAAVLKAAGLRIYTFGVAGTSLDKEQNRKLFEFAKRLGIRVIIVEPGDYKILDNLEELAKEYDIRVALHNHGIRSLYGNPAVVRALLKHRDPRLGVCMDAGWIASTGLDPTDTFKQYEGRVFDLHLKDKRVTATVGEDVAVDTHIGAGDGKLGNLLAELKRSQWPGVLAIETDSGEFARQPDEFVAKAKAFVQAEAAK
jgi:L-ribulose-5-phosphate 3-epimerase